MFQEQLAALSNVDLDGNTVLFHLGDWNPTSSSSCLESSYQEMDALYSHSGIPVYLVPGNTDIIDCTNPQQAQGYWYKYLLRYDEKHWPLPTAWNVTRQEENFAYLYNGVLFVGIHFVDNSDREGATEEEWQGQMQASF